jgi:FKBP-type peptidyl-prolyl cis-trans isomerase 2
MYKYFVIFSLFALSACTLGPVNIPTPAEPTNPTTKGETPAPQEIQKNPVVSLNYTLRVGAPDGKILETTKEDVAKANGLYSASGQYTPFEVTLGMNRVIPGFERGIAMMKKGEKKTIEVLPKDGYGEASISKTVRESEVAPEFTITTDRSQFEDTSVQTVERNLLGEQWKNLVVGQTLTGGANVTAKVVKIDGDSITLSINNVNNPFYGKKLAVGEKTKKDNISFDIKSLTQTGITVRIMNGDSPFAGKSFVVWATGAIPGKNGGPSPGDIKVLAISGEAIDIAIPNTHPLAGKTLYFDIEIVDIK